MRQSRVVEFDTRAFPLRSAIFGCLRDFVRDAGRGELTRLEDLHRFVGPTDVSGAYAALYRFAGGAEFRGIYGRLAAHIVAAHFEPGAAFQRVPSFRIHLVDQKSVQYHNDLWYGHGDDVVNFWLPFTHVFGNNSMTVSTESASKRMELEFFDSHYTMREMNEIIRRESRPLEMDFGQAFMFSSRLMHGTEVNDTDTSRVSMDFRVLPAGADAGAKPETFFVIPETYAAAFDEQQPREEQRIAIAYVGVGPTVTRRISQKIQQLVCAKYAEDIGAALLTAETEIVTMKHHPMLFDLLEGNGGRNCDILMLFSVDLLPAAEGEIRRVFDMARRRDIEVRFVAEDMVIPPDADEAQIKSIIDERHAMEWKSR